MRIEYTCADGSRTLAKWPSMALLHWLGRSHPTRPIENPEPFKLYVDKCHYIPSACVPIHSEQWRAKVSENDPH